MARMPKWKEALPKRLIAKYEPVRRPGEGLRLPDFIHETSSDYFRLDKPVPGAYVKCVGVPMGAHEWGAACDVCLRCGMGTREVVAAEDAEAAGVCQAISWWYCDPNGHWGTVRRSEVTEHEDGTITVYRTIENTGPYLDAWCGTLVRGVWTAIEAEEQMAL